VTGTIFFYEKEVRRDENRSKGDGECRQELRDNGKQ
jgi:hypothetical protein